MKRLYLAAIWLTTLLNDWNLDIWLAGESLCGAPGIDHMRYHEIKKILDLEMSASSTTIANQEAPGLAYVCKV